MAANETDVKSNSDASRQKGSAGTSDLPRPHIAVVYHKTNILYSEEDVKYVRDKIFNELGFDKIGIHVVVDYYNATKKLTLHSEYLYDAVIVLFGLGDFPIDYEEMDDQLKIVAKHIKKEPEKHSFVGALKFVKHPGSCPDVVRDPPSNFKPDAFYKLKNATSLDESFTCPHTTQHAFRNTALKLKTSPALAEAMRRVQAEADKAVVDAKAAADADAKAAADTKAEEEAMAAAEAEADAAAIAATAAARAAAAAAPEAAAAKPEPASAAAKSAAKHAAKVDPASAAPTAPGAKPAPVMRFSAYKMKTPSGNDVAAAKPAAGSRKGDSSKLRPPGNK